MIDIGWIKLKIKNKKSNEKEKKYKFELISYNNLISYKINELIAQYYLIESNKSKLNDNAKNYLLKIEELIPKIIELNQLCNEKDNEIEKKLIDLINITKAIIIDLNNEVKKNLKNELIVLNKLLINK